MVNYDYDGYTVIKCINNELPTIYGRNNVVAAIEIEYIKIRW